MGKTQNNFWETSISTLVETRVYVWSSFPIQINIYESTADTFNILYSGNTTRQY